MVFINNPEFSAHGSELIGFLSRNCLPKVQRFNYLAVKLHTLTTPLLAKQHNCRFYT